MLFKITHQSREGREGREGRGKERKTLNRTKEEKKKDGEEERLRDDQKTQCNTERKKERIYCIKKQIKETNSRRRRSVWSEVFSVSSCWLRETLEPQTEVKRSLCLRHLHLVSRGKKKKRNENTKRLHFTFYNNNRRRRSGWKQKEKKKKSVPVFPSEGNTLSLVNWPLNHKLYLNCHIHHLINSFIHVTNI